MFTKVHHVTYAVHNIERMADYLHQNFGLIPEKVGDEPERGRKWILYRIGPTIVDFFQPTSADTDLARELREKGPGVRHVAWGVEGIDRVFQDLKRQGNEVRGTGPSTSGFGYRTVNIEPSSSHGILFQLAEGEMS